MSLPGTSRHGVLAAFWGGSVLLPLALLVACEVAGPMPQELAPIPEPRLERMEAAVRQQLEEKRRQLTEVLARQGPVSSRGARLFGELGRLYHAYDLLEAAWPCYENAQTLLPEEFRWPYYLGILHQSEGRLGEARESFERALALRPRDVPALLRLGDVHLEENEAQLAGAVFQRALAAKADDAAVHYGLGRAALAQGRWGDAVASFTRALEIEPQASGIHYSLGLAHQRLGDLEKAQSHLERQGTIQGAIQVTLEDPLLAEIVALSRSVGLYLQRGGQALRTGQSAIAVAEFRKALELDPQSAPAHQSLGAALTRQGDLKGALEHYGRALEIDPQNAIVAYNLGTLYKRQGAQGQAEAHLLQAVRLDPALVDARLTLAALYEQASRYGDADAEYAAVLRGEPQNVPARARRALLRVYTEGPREAIRVLQRLAEEAPGHPDVHLNLGSALATAGELDAARGHFQAVLRADAGPPEKALAHANLARVLERQGALDEATAHLRAALDLNPGLTPFRFTLAGLLGTQGHFAEAAEQYARVIELEPRQGPARRGEANALVLAGRFEEARRRLEEGLALLPQDGHLAHALARLLAGSPDPEIRDGRRALELALGVFEAQKSLEHAETVAMALAEVGRFEEAVQWQQTVLDDAVKAGDAAFLERLRRNLTRYRGQRTVEAPWRSQGPD